MLNPWKKSNDKRDSILESRDITLLTKVCIVKTMGFPVVKYTCESWTWRRLSTVFSSYWCLWTVVLEKILERPLDLKKDQTRNPKESTMNIDWKGWCWSWSSYTLTIWCKEPAHWRRPWCWERLKAGEEGDNRGWDGWMTSSTQWTWIWANSGRWWWTGEPAALQSMGCPKRAGQD